VAKLLWGKVYYKEHFAGYLREEPGQSVSFTYDESYLDSSCPDIAHTLPKRGAPYISHAGLHPFFDNLVAEGWLEQAQARLLGKRLTTRFEHLLAFGLDCAGAVSVIDPEPAGLNQALADLTDPLEVAALASRASLSGVQPKLVLINDNNKLRPAKNSELSTHIAKFSSKHHGDLVLNEYLTTLAFKALLPDDDVVELWIEELEGISQPALVIKRFDRGPHDERLHFEEFNQLLNFPPIDKYDADYKDMADFIQTTENCLPIEVYRLFLRIIAGLMLGNTDMHLKNFAMYHTDAGLRLTPSYDQVAACIYNYKTVALALAGSYDRDYGSLKAKHIIRLGKEFGLSAPAINMACEQLAKNKDAAVEAVSSAPFGSPFLKQKIIEVMDKRWNGTFNLIGKELSQKQWLAVSSKNSRKSS